MATCAFDSPQARSAYHGTRIALQVGIIVVAVESLIGVTLGLLAGYYGGTVDKIIMFITDLTWSLPPLIMALAIVTVLGPSLNNVMISIAVVSWAQFTRIVRAKTQSIKNMPYVEAARAFGESDFNILKNNTDVLNDDDYFDINKDKYQVSSPI